MDGHFVVHSSMGGSDRVIGSFDVMNGQIQYSDYASQLNCDLFPPGKIDWMTSRRLETLLNNRGKSVYLTRG
jgi:hypothetical protein